MEPFRAAPRAVNDDTPPAPFARPRDRGPRPSLELPPELAGGVVAGYALETPLGQGGMSWTFRARRSATGELIALKVLDPALARERPEMAERFHREGEAALALDHPNLVRAVEHGTCPTTGIQFIALELVEGQTAEDMLATRGVIPEPEALNIALGVAQALAFLEQRRIIHRDVKPSNILVDAAGTAKLADLGVAKLLNSATLTAAGAAVGTPHYIAPEQAIGMDEVDNRADLYSLGVTLFRLVTGEFPFAGEGFLDIVTRHVNEDLPDPRSLEPRVTLDTARVIASLAARDPGDRYPDARTAAEDLARVLLGQGAVGSPGARVNGAAPPLAHRRPEPAPQPKTARHLDVDGPTPPSLPRSGARGGGADLAGQAKSRLPEDASLEALRRAQPAGGLAATPPSGQARPLAPAPRAPGRARTPLPPPRSPTLRVTVRTGSNVLSRKKFDQDTITIGREPRCDVQIDNPMVSRHHCEIRRSGARFTVLERNTTNGTYLDGHRLEGERDLKPGDVIGVTRKFEVEVAWDVISAPPEVAPPQVDDEATAAEQTFFDEPLDDDDPYAQTPTPGLSPPEPPSGPHRAPAAPSTATGVRGRVTFLRAGQPQRQVVEEWFQVGRSPECDLRLESSFAPRKAFVIVRGVRDYLLFNVAPYPQTVLVNGRPTDDTAVLRDGDKISAYGVEVLFEVVGP